jgi:hypothetical protein
MLKNWLSREFASGQDFSRSAGILFLIFRAEFKLVRAATLSR